MSWVDYRNGAPDVYLQHIISNGQIAAGWPSQGVPVCTAPDDQFVGMLIPDGSGGVYLVWHDYRDRPTNDADIYLQRVLADGTIAPGWPGNGLAIVALPGTQRFPVLAPDGQGGVFVAWSDERSGAGTRDVYMQHITADGAVAAGWPAEGFGAAVAPGRQSFPAILADGSGGVFLSWTDTRNAATSVADIYGLRVDWSGVPAAGWAPNGNLVCGAEGAQSNSELSAASDGGAYIAFNDFRTASSADPFEESHRDIYCMRMTADGALHPDWPPEGVAVCTAPQTQQALQLAPDGAGGLYLAWQDNRDSDYDVYLQRLQPGATLAPGWPVNGLRPLPSLPGFQLQPHLAPDGANGVYLSINNLTNIYQVHTQHMTGAGIPAPGWPDFGQPASAIETDEDESQITADGFGGAIVVWKDFRNQKDDLYARRLQPLGPTATLVSLHSASAEPGLARLAWLVTGEASLQATIERRTQASDWLALGTAITDGSGRIAFEDATVEPGARYAYRLRYSAGNAEATTSETWLDVPARFELALPGARPNPARRGDLAIAFTLPDGAPAALELFDVSGRRVASRAVGALGAGRHMVRLDEARHAGAGVYWVRLVHPGRVLTTKAVIAE